MFGSSCIIQRRTLLRIQLLMQQAHHQILHHQFLDLILSISPGYCRYFSIGSEYGRKGGECLHSLKILSILNTQFCNLIFLLKLIFHDFLAAATTFDRFLLMTGCSLHRYMLLLPLAVAVGLLLSEKCYPLNTSVATVTLGRKKMCSVYHQNSLLLHRVGHD